METSSMPKFSLLLAAALLPASLVAKPIANPIGREDYAALDGDAIIVTGKVEGYRTIETTSGTKTNTPILDVPQSISVLTSAQLRDQAIYSLSDAVRGIPGLSAGQGEGNRDQITFRGNNSTADFFVDGLRDDVQYIRSLYNIDRIEVHKGPNAMIFGRGGGGGVLNRITKGAVENETLISSTASLTSFGNWSAQGDINLPIGAAALRLNAFYEKLKNHRDVFGGERYGVNPTVGAAISDTTKVELGYEYVYDKRVTDRGIPSAFAGTIATPAGPADNLRDRFFGTAALNSATIKAHLIRFRSVTKLSEGLTFSTQGFYGDYDKIYTNAFAVTPISGSVTAPTVGIEAYRDPTTRKTFIAQSNLEWRVETGALSHVILAGVEYTKQNSANERINGFFNPNQLSAAGRRQFVPLANPIAIPPVFFVRGAAGNSNRAVTSKLTQYSAYVQDQIKIGSQFEIIAGLRYDRFKLGVTNLFTAQNFNRAEGLWSPRVGVVYKPVPNASLYASYAKSFLPQSGDQFLNLDVSLQNLAPETFDNYELGAKWDILDGLTATAALYQLDRGNTRATGATPGTTVLTGAQRTQGFEAALTGKITPQWQVSLGYANTSAKIIRTTTAAPNGRRVAQVPRHQLSLWTRYDITDYLGLGFGAYHQSRSFTTISNVSFIPAYTRFDAALFLHVNEKIKAQVNVENITNIRYFPVAHNDNNISTGAPLNARLSVSVDF
jgi:catecholate siderophore receptor